MLTHPIGPVENCENGLAPAFLQQEDVRQPIFGCISHEVEGLRRMRIPSHVDEVTVLHQRHPIGVEKKRRQIVANLEHSAGNRRERNGNSGFIEGQRPLAAVPFLIHYRLPRN